MPLLSFVRISAALVVAVFSTALAVGAPGDPQDPNIIYVGRWDRAVPTAPVGYYGGVYLRTLFTGTTIRLILNQPANIGFEIDGTISTDPNDFPAGTQNLTPTPLANGIHHIRVWLKGTANVQPDSFNFGGFILDTGATTTKPLTRPTIEFVGDSITAGLNAETVNYKAAAHLSFAWKTGDRLKREHTQIATPGITLSDLGTTPQQRGMNYWYFQDRERGIPNDGPWTDPSPPEVVVIQIGTNDALPGNNIQPNDFSNTYRAFISAIHGVNPNARIVALRTFTNKLSLETEAAVFELRDLGMPNVDYKNSAYWWRIDYPGYMQSDGHPTELGHIGITQPLVEYLSRLLNEPIYVMVDSNYDTSYTKDLAMDGNIHLVASRWLSANTPPTADPATHHWYEIGYQEKKAISKVRFWSGSPANAGIHIRGYQLEYWDGAAWQNFGAGDSANTKDGFYGQFVERTMTPAISTTRFRLRISKGSAIDDIARLMEIQINPQ